MANYKEQISTGKSWVRCRSLLVENPLGGVGSAVFTETNAVEVGGVASEQFKGLLNKTFDPAGTIPLRNPETGELTGQSVSHGELYVILYSLYMQTALERDAQEAPVG